MRINRDCKWLLIKINKDLFNFCNSVLVRYVRGADPIIKLMDEEGEVMETLAIDKWNTDSVEEFLNTYLILPGSADDDFSQFDQANNEI